MKHVVNNYEQLLEKVRELVKDGYRQTDVTEHEIVFEKAYALGILYFLLFGKQIN